MGIFNLKEAQIQRDCTSVLAKERLISCVVANALLNMINLEIYFFPKWKNSKYFDFAIFFPGRN